MSLRSLFRRLAPELIPAFMLSLLVIGLWWWFNARPASPPRLDSACSRPVEIRIQGQGPGSYVACSLEEWIEVGRRLELPSGWPENDLLGDGFFSEGQPPCRVTLSAQGQLVSVEEGVLSGSVALALDVPMDVNRASAHDLEALPGVGPSVAQAIVSNREANGPFCSIQELDRVKGIGPAFLEKHRQSLTASCP